MPTVTHKDICDGIRDTVGAAAGIKRVQSVDEITESIPEMDMPLLMVYPQAWGADTGGETQKSSFGSSPLIQASPVYVADVYIPSKSGIAESFGVLVNVADEIDLLIEAQTTLPLFGVLADDGITKAIKSFQWTGERVTLEYASVNYDGIRYTFTMSIF